MSENIENTQPTEDEVQGAREAEAPQMEEQPTDGGGPAVPEGLREVDPAKLAEVRAKLAAFMEKRGKTVSGAEDPDSPAVRGEEVAGGADGDKPVGQTIAGADVDWSEYDLQYGVRHLYPEARFQDTPQGPKWVAMLDEFYSTERDARNHGKMMNAAGSETEKEPLNLGEYLTQMTNGPEGWNIAAILPGGQSRAIVILRKAAAYVLPDPVPLKKMEEVAPPTDPELQATEDAALQFAEDEGLTPPALEEDNGVEEREPDAPEVTQEELDAQAADFARRALPRGAVEVEKETGALPARVSELITKAIERNRAETLPPPVPPRIQPPAVDPSHGKQGEAFDGAAGVENIRAGMRNILEGPDFNLGKKG